MEGCKPNNVPLNRSLIPLMENANAQNENKPNKIPFRELMGCVMFLATSTRPDIMYAVSYLAKFMSTYGDVHCTAAKSLLRYLKGTQNMGLRFNADETVLGYTDSDWAGDTMTRNSRSGYVFQIGDTSISWKSKQQSVVAASSVEAEYIAKSHAVKESLWIRTICQEFDLLIDRKPFKVFADNTGAIALANDSIISNRSKHIDVSYHLIRDYVEMGKVILEYISTDLMVADGLTKALAAVKHKKFVEMLGLKAV